jgi:hypothetical protein
MKKLVDSIYFIHIEVKTLQGQNNLWELIRVIPSDIETPSGHKKRPEPVRPSNI